MRNFGQSRMVPPIEIDVEFQSIYHAEMAWAGVSEIPPMHQSEMHKHDFWEFMYVHGGTGRTRAGQFQFPVREGDMVVYPPGVEHIEYAGQSGLRVKVLSIINTSDMDFMNFWPIDDARHMHIADSWLSEAFDRITNRILDELKRMDTAYTIRVKALCFELLSYLVQYADQGAERQNTPQQHHHVIRTKQYIEAHYSQNIKLTDIAAENYVSTYYLAHLFKEYTGYSPMNYLATLRLHKAQELLRSTRHSVSEISRMVGYEDLQHFSNAFKKYAGQSPRAYRQQCAEGNTEKNQ